MEMSTFYIGTPSIDKYNNAHLHIHDGPLSSPNTSTSCETMLSGCQSVESADINRLC